MDDSSLCREGAQHDGDLGKPQKRKAGALNSAVAEHTWRSSKMGESCSMSMAGGASNLEELHRRMQASIDSLSRTLLGRVGAGTAGSQPEVGAAAAGGGADPDPAAASQRARSAVCLPGRDLLDHCPSGLGGHPGPLGLASGPLQPGAAAQGTAAAPTPVCPASRQAAALACGIPRGVAAMMATPGFSTGLQPKPVSAPLASQLPLATVEATTNVDLSSAEEAAKARALSTLSCPEVAQSAISQMQGLSPALGASAVLMQSTSSELPLEQQLVIQHATTIAQQTQLLQQHQFYSQCRVFEAQRSAKGSSLGRLPTRFKDGYRPMRMCKSLVKFGACLRGEECTFAHTYDELHPASADLQSEGAGVLGAVLAQQEPPSFLNAEPNMQVRKKRDMCQRMVKSGCLLGTRCMFAHSEEELGTVALVITDVRVKRQICKYWESGRCGYGSYCVNAHGAEEIGKLKPPEELCPAGQSVPATRQA